MMSLLERLRTETRPLHEQTEQLLYTEALRGGTLSLEQYGHLLLTHLAYHQALEQAIDRQPAFFRDYTPDSRRKTLWLVADLDSLTRVPSSWPDAFADWTPIELLGAAYVGEGSMLGGKTVWQYLQQSPALQTVLPTARFYRGYGTETGQQWKAFGQFITEQGTPYADQVVEAAGRAFHRYRRLFGQTKPALLLSAESSGHSWYSLTDDHF